jgi:uncharacterized protein (DUF362 family)
VNVVGIEGRSAGMTRRAFLGVPVAALAAQACHGGGPPFVASDFVVPSHSAVGIFPAAHYGVDLVDVISRGLDSLRIDVRGRSVLLKPNMVEYEEGQAINTHPLVVVGAAEALRRAGAREVVVGEGPGHRRDIEYLLASTGLYDHLRENRLRFVDLNHDDVRDVPTRSWFTGLRSLALPVSVLAADLVVSLPKLKTHHWAGITCSMKNFFGVVPGAVYGWPKNLLHFRGIDASILDVVTTVRPALTIVDGVTAMEGDGPIMGRARPLGFIAMGTDLAAVDATCARVIGLDPENIAYLDASGRFLGNIAERRIDQRGESPERYYSTFDVVESWRSKRLRS